ncbi:MAG: glycosyltransferase family 2 protein [Oscillospiraceae bacterium]|nr:glycosyltransferase family 2 protein [Oscillospiraceae bacterium]
MDKDSIKVSVIIPVYNPGECIRRCLLSLKNQTLKEYELIFVDDCSTDDSLSIIQDCFNNDPRVHVIINETNMGPGYSRNAGIEIAKGEYLAFLDPDDYIEDNFLELLYSMSSAKTTIIKGSRVIVNENGELVDERDHLNADIRLGVNASKPLFTLFTHCHWSAIYSRDFIISSGIRYGTTRNGEDTTFLLKACFITDNIQFQDNAFYYYTMREGSSVRKYTRTRLQNDMQAFREKMEFLTPRFIENTAGFTYVNDLITYLLQLEIASAVRDKNIDFAVEFRNELRNYCSNLPFKDGLISRSMGTKGLIVYGENLTKIPYDVSMSKVPYTEYLYIVKNWVHFVKNHPEYIEECKGSLWYVFEKAIEHIDGTRNRKKALKELRSLAKEIPDRKVFTKGYISMKMFLDYGINTFGLRTSKAGCLGRRLLRRLRKQ